MNLKGAASIKKYSKRNIFFNLKWNIFYDKFNKISIFYWKKIKDLKILKFKKKFLYTY